MHSLLSLTYNFLREYFYFILLPNGISRSPKYRTPTQENISSRHCLHNINRKKTMGPHQQYASSWTLVYYDNNWWCEGIWKTDKLFMTGSQGFWNRVDLEIQDNLYSIEPLMSLLIGTLGVQKHIYQLELIVSDSVGVL